MAPVAVALVVVVVALVAVVVDPVVADLVVVVAGALVGPVDVRPVVLAVSVPQRSPWWSSKRVTNGLSDRVTINNK